MGYRITIRSADRIYGTPEKYVVNIPKYTSEDATQPKKIKVWVGATSVVAAVLELRLNGACLTRHISTGSTAGVSACLIDTTGVGTGVFYAQTLEGRLEISFYIDGTPAADVDEHVIHLLVCD